MKLSISAHTHCPIATDTWAPLRVKLFLWLVLRRRHWTADKRRRHGLDTHELCFLYAQEPETIDDIIVSCSFSQQVWWEVRAVLHETRHLPACHSILDWWPPGEASG